MMSESLYSLFLPPEGYLGDFGLFCGFTASPDTLAQIKRRFSPEASRPALAAFIHPTTNAISDVPGLAWIWMDPARPGYNLLHAKVALLGFRQRHEDRYLIRLAVSTGNWTQDPLTDSIDMYWSLDLDPHRRPASQSIADIRSAWSLFNWLRQRGDTSLIARSYDGLRPDAMLAAAITGLPESEATPRFIDSRQNALMEQVIDRLSRGRKQNHLIVGSGFFEGKNNSAESVPERVRRRLMERGKLAVDCISYLTLNATACQDLASRAPQMQDWYIRAPRSPAHQPNAKLHAKFIAVTNRGSSEDRVQGKVYLGSGNLSRMGFEIAARRGGNLEAGVVFDVSDLQWRKNSRNDIRKYLPIDFDEPIQPASLLPGSDFERPEEPESQPPITFLLWFAGQLSAPEGKAIKVLQDGNIVTTPCAWPSPAPAVVVTAKDGWRLPVIAEGVLVAPRPQHMTVEDILAGLANFPEPAEDDVDTEIDGKQIGDAAAEITHTPPTVYAIRRMMQLLVPLAEAQARVALRDWPRWCRELRQNLLALSQSEEETISFFRKARANPLPALLDHRMRPDGVEVQELQAALAAVADNWRLGSCPSLWATEVA
ncbi:hypothetical protein [Paracoccus marcusii]|uniref:hypothetical protein n=1 Tax=Paracoccus marcusii TaxID=59779 RepID=UPI0032663E05